MDWKYEEGRIYSTDDQGTLMAETTFVRLPNGEIDIDSTYVNSSLRGQGVAGKMMKVVADYIRQENLKTTATCSYANSWLKKNEQEYADIISADLDCQNPACRIDTKH
jgi:predicted GNAT family acetyltransferase